MMMKSVTTDRYPSGAGVDKAAVAKRMFNCVVLQGETNPLLRPTASLIATVGMELPTGSICFHDPAKQNTASNVAPTVTATNVPVAYIVYVGNDRPEVVSSKGNTAGGVITALPLTGRSLIQTTVYDKSITDYAHGDLLTIKVDAIFGKTNVLMLTRAVDATSFIVGVVDSVGVDQDGRGVINFTAKA